VNHRDLKPLEATDEELLAAREMTDAGLGSAMPQFFERLTHKPEPEGRPALDHELATATGADLLELRERVLAMGARLPLENQDIHLAFNAMVNEIDRLAGVIAERWGE
jgi:hypothetical protein